jgi:cyclopropane-fatty-acyl-phospholipid synthase
MLLARSLSALIRQGRLRLIDHRGRSFDFGDGTGPEVALRLLDARVGRVIAFDPDLKLGEAYMDGRIALEAGDLLDLFELVFKNGFELGRRLPLVPKLHRWARYLLRRLDQWNPAARAQKNVAHHYDLSGALYDLFLDADRQYSCAYFARPDLDLDQAQDAKKRHIAAKLLLQPGHRVLDIGSGWGGLGLHLARETGAEVTGITLSAEQFKVANARMREAGLEGRLRFDLVDYRAMTGRFDRIVSVGMFEHVGIGHYPGYFGKLRELLAEDGVALLHSIGRSGPPTATNAWIAKYIFPGGYVPALSEVLGAIEKAGLIATDVEVLRRHYAETLRHWRQRFAANRARVRALYDERFCRMWEYYLAASEAAFRWNGLMVFQIQLARRPDVIPITRDYMVDRERGNAAARSSKAA